MASSDNKNQVLSFTITQNDKTVTVTENTVIDMLRQLVKIRGNTYYGLEVGKELNAVLGKSLSHTKIVNEFHKLYYGPYSLPVQPWNNQEWMGCKILKCPCDMMILQEIIYETKPDTVIETGTFNGGSAYYISHCLFLAGKENAQIITIDVDSREKYPNFRNMITYINGSSTDPSIFEKVKKMAKGKIMVILDSDHRKHHVIKEMELFAPLVSKGCYMIVEDSNINGHPALPGFGPGPYEAIHEYLSRHDDFEIDKSREKHLLTMFPDGYLKKR